MLELHRLKIALDEVPSRWELFTAVAWNKSDGDWS